MIIVSKKAAPCLIEYLSSLDEVELFGPLKSVGSGIACHPDVLYCRLGGGADAAVFKGNEVLLGEKYPADCRYNAVVLREFIIHKQGITDSALLATAMYGSASSGSDIQQDRTAVREFINVPQGYTKCNIVVVDDEHIITSDEGIAKAVTTKADSARFDSGKTSSAKLNCLLISPKQIELPGFPYGFIGGCSGRVDNKIIFNGNLKAHSDFRRISAFIESCELELVYFEDWPLTDIGSIISRSSIF